MRNLLFIAFICLLMACSADSNKDIDMRLERAASSSKPQGTLFIIGGGKRPVRVLKAMVQSAEREGAYALIFPHSGSEPDSSHHYIARELVKYTEMPIIQVKNGQLRNSLIDSVRKAPLIFLTGGDQSRFLDKVHPAVRRAIGEAYHEGATIGGTSAGAALMSTVMITGDQRDWPAYESSYSRLHHENAIYSTGLGLIDSVIIDQHFVARSRYNRLISALADTHYPHAAGVDEATALVVTPEYLTVLGESQVVWMSRPEAFKRLRNKIGLRQMEMNIYLEGDTFKLNQSR